MNKVFQGAPDDRRPGQPLGQSGRQYFFKVVQYGRALTLLAADLDHDRIGWENTLAVMEADQDRRFLSGEDRLRKAHLDVDLLKARASREKPDYHRGGHEREDQEKKVVGGVPR